MQIQVQLWQISLAAILGAISLIGFGFSLASMFVKRGECHRHIDSVNTTLDKIFRKLDDLEQGLAFLKGKFLKG